MSKCGWIGNKGMVKLLFAFDLPVDGGKCAVPQKNKRTTSPPESKLVVL